MFKDNKKLILALAVLTGLFFFVRWMKADKNIRNFNTELIVMDTTQVSRISLFPKAENHEEIKFTKDDGNWLVSKNNISSPIPNDQVKSLLSSLLTVKPQRLAARTKDKWAQFEVNDSLGTRVVIENNAGKAMVDLVIGKFSYKQAPGPPGAGGQNSISGLTYVRNSNEEETFATEGFLSMTFNRNFDSFRDKKVVECTPENVRSLSFQSPIGSFTLNKLGSDWMLGESKADSVLVAGYVNQLRNVSASKIDDNFVPSGNGDYRCTISGDNMEEISVAAYANGGVFKLLSSINPTTVFESDSAGVFSKVFKTELDFVAGE